MPIVCGIKFRGTGKVYFFAPGDGQCLEADDYVIVETSRGRELAQVAVGPHEVDDAEIVGQLKPIIRPATTADLLDAELYRQKEADAVEKCKEEVARSGLPMKVVGAEYNYDGTRLTFFFTSEQRVDFRELVRELARIFRTRIELRQVGVRDESRILGGIGKCGRPLCCATWLTDFYPVSIRMAKQQDLPLSPMEISGLCGRLLCCLGYENDHYCEIKSRFPKVGKSIDSPCGPAKVMRVDVLNETVFLLLEDGSTAELTAEQLSGEARIECRNDPDALSADQMNSLDDLLGPYDADASPEEDDGDNKRPTSSRPPSRPNPRPRPTPAAESATTESAANEKGGPSASGQARSGNRRRRPRRPEAPREASAQQPSAANAPAEQGERPAGSQATRSRRRRPQRRQDKPASQQQSPSSPASD